MNIKILHKTEEIRFDKSHGEPDLAQCWWDEGNYVMTRSVKDGEKSYGLVMLSIGSVLMMFGIN